MLFRSAALRLRRLLDEAARRQCSGIGLKDEAPMGLSGGGSAAFLLAGD